MLPLMFEKGSSRVGKKFFSGVIQSGGAKVLTVGLGVTLAVMLGIAATIPSTSGTASAQSTVIDPVSHVQVAKKYDAVQNPNVLFHGVGARLTIHKPSVGNPNLTPDLSVAEIVIGNPQPIPGKQPAAAVELGWIVAPREYQDNEPHLFIFVRKAGKGCLVSGNNVGDGACGFTPVSNPKNIQPNEDLTTLTPRVVNYGTSNNYGPQAFHIGYFKGNNAWWIGFQNHWIGHISANWFKKGLSGPAFTKATRALWYGEVGSTRNELPCVDMGNGKFGTKAGSARFTGMFYEKMSGNQSKLYYTKNARPSLAGGDPPRAWKFWNGKESSGRSFRYGGPGKCP